MSLRIPYTEAERWRLVEQSLRQYEVDINRLWRRLDQLSGMGEGASSGSVDPAIYTPPHGLAGDCPNQYILEHMGNPSGGTSTLKLYGEYQGVTLAAGMTAVIDWDATIEEIQAALETANGYDPEADPVTGFAVIVSEGPLPDNDVKITLPRGVHLQYLTNTLTPASIIRYGKVRSCCGST